MAEGWDSNHGSVASDASILPNVQQQRLNYLPKANSLYVAYEMQRYRCNAQSIRL